MLSLQREAAEFSVWNAALAFGVYKVSGIQLNGRFCGKCGQRNAGFAALGNGELAEFSARFMKNQIVVVAACVDYWRFLAENISADLLCFAKVERRTLNIQDFAGRDTLAVGLGKALRVDLKGVTQNIISVVTVEVEVRVIGQIDDRVLIGGGSVTDLKRIVICQTVAQFGFQRTGVALLGRRTCKAEYHRVILNHAVVDLEREDPVQMVGAVGVF